MDLGFNQGWSPGIYIDFCEIRVSQIHWLISYHRLCLSYFFPSELPENKSKSAIWRHSCSIISHVYPIYPRNLLIIVGFIPQKLLLESPCVQNTNTPRRETLSNSLASLFWSEIWYTPSSLGRFLGAPSQPQ